MSGATTTITYRGPHGERRVACETHGLGTPVIAVHSGPGFGAATLRPGVEIACAQHSITLVDLPGCGRSSRHPGSGYPIDAYIEDLLRVGAALGSARPWLLGHGWGAILAVETALAQPQAVAGVVLVNPLRVLDATGQDQDAQARQVRITDETLTARFGDAVLPLLQQALQGLAPWETVDRHPWWRQMWRTQWAGPPSARWVAAMDDVALGMEAYFDHKGQAMFDASSHWARYDLAPRVAALGCPVSIITSGHDANYVALPALHVEPLRALRPDLVVERVDDAGHFLMAEAPRTLAAHLARHVR